MGTTTEQLSNTPYRHIGTHPISGALGAEITGVDLARPLPDEVMAELRRPLLAHQVIQPHNFNINRSRRLELRPALQVQLGLEHRVRGPVIPTQNVHGCAAGLGTARDIERLD